MENDRSRWDARQNTAPGGSVPALDRDVDLPTRRDEELQMDRPPMIVRDEPVVVRTSPTPVPPPPTRSRS